MLASTGPMADHCNIYIPSESGMTESTMIRGQMANHAREPCLGVDVNGVCHCAGFNPVEKRSKLARVTQLSNQCRSIGDG